MSQNPLISVIIPIYNVEQYLDECLNSVINQNYKNLEIILVDDGSTDKSGEICDEFAAQDSRIKVLHQKNGGVSVARNNALNIVSGEFIAFVDSDDTIEKNHISNMVNLLNDNTDIVCVPMNGKMAEFKFNGEYALKYILTERRTPKSGYFSWSIWNKIFKTDIVKNIRFLADEKVGEDFSFMWKAFLNSKEVVFGGNASYNYRVSTTSVIHSNFNQKHHSLLLVCDRFIDYVKKNNPNLVQNAQLAKAARLIDLIYYSRSDKKNAEFNKLYIRELRKLQSLVYKEKSLPFKFKLIVFLHSNLSCLLTLRSKIKEKFKK
ncbi:MULTISPECIES: glycosyltransferase family 2 protein [unclassified Campylobacter]|uniref:glycosyltransferase family 2 protein n=1 Tax=unclassified Campylobacter TaxID=2593542 RepID=UPI0022E9E6FD|nr:MULTISPECIES: glycosyltransferase [unclassified Campylobacter]MDA3042877.1 glycosyltransferase [Campylobacter sp. JMF_09 ED2]MDA3044288.1 glycosyltransferase [Campylobacter sp. JMF_07 ED4]MDA3063637.1 glycosyltransferase [Campylobacter sp. JMF_11 EL3]MDA3071263.1 glycosyltransferase [Campylobacter sp. VBCF_03 NA9]MDA3074723.1 glycosyltransferase [Campylobacter sp. JMF_05 ED3]